MQLTTYGCHEGGVRVQLCGSVAPGETHALSAHLGSLLRGHPYVVADLDRFDGGDLAAVAAATVLLGDAVESAGGWPGAVLVLSCRDPELRATLRSIPALVNIVVAGSVEQARRRYGDRPDRLCAEWAFSDRPSVLAEARCAVATRARSWSVVAPGGDLDDLVMVANELLTNALEHARSGAVVRMTLERDTLEVAVRDRCADPPRRQTFSPTASRGRGLQVVEALSDEWGWAPHDDGKVVWARMNPSGREN